MKVRIAVPVVVVALLLAGCQVIPYEKTVKPRGAKDCRGVANCTVDVHPEIGQLPEDVLASKNQAGVLVWKLDPKSDWEWLWSGIVFEPRAAGVIDCSGVHPGPVRTCKNSGAEGKFKFGVKLVNWKTFPPQIIDYDPFVMNQ